jgi:adenine-specific DNA-methyltransferase
MSEIDLSKKLNLIQGDCLEVLKQLPDKSIDLVILDPPYYKIKNDEWDNQWKTFDDYLDWIEKISLLIRKKMKISGSFYIFGDDERIAYIQVRLDKHFTFLNHLIWFKVNNMCLKYASAHRKFAPMSERILFYCLEDKTGLERITDNFIKPKNPFALYLTEEFRKAKISNLEIAKLFPSKNGGLTGCVSNWTNGDNVITKEQYLKVKNYLNRQEGQEYLRKEYEDLRKEYENERRTWNFQNGIHEVISNPIITIKENTNHSTTKPINLIEKLVKSSSNRGDLILDCFMGSGTTGCASLKLGRRFVGIELDEGYFRIAERRCKEWENQERLF